MNSYQVLVTRTTTQETFWTTIKADTASAAWEKAIAKLGQAHEIMTTRNYNELY